MKVIKINKEFEERYIIINNETGEIIDDAQGYGYKTSKKAYAAYYYKYKGGRERQIKYQIFWKNNIEIAEYIDELVVYWSKEISKKNVSYSKILKTVNDHFNVSITPEQFKYFELAFEKDIRRKR